MLIEKLADTETEEFAFLSLFAVFP